MKHSPLCRVVAVPHSRARVGQITVFILSLAVLSSPCARAEKLEQLTPRGYVNDFAGVLDSRTSQELTNLCTEVDQKAHAQIAVVTIKTLEGVPIEDFANRLFQRWGIGPKSNDRGVLILLAISDHRYRVEVGYGLEPILPDGKVGGFGREIVPLLRQSNYSQALLQLTRDIAGTIAADRGVTLETAPARQVAAPAKALGGPVKLLIVLFVAFILFSVVGGMASLAWTVFGGRNRGRIFRGPWGGPWIGGPGWGGGGFGGGGSGGGFGGFGGGSSGGGGASGSW